MDRVAKVLDRDVKTSDGVVYFCSKKWVWIQRDPYGIAIHHDRQRCEIGSCTAFGGYTTTASTGG